LVKVSTPTRTRRSDGARTHEAILEASAKLASIEGINGLTIGRLADELGVSKSGLFAHFGSKEALQLETIEAAQAIFDREVMQPTYAAPAGRPRLKALFAAFFSYLERDVFPGGCFFAGLLADEDARSGPVHEATERIEREWIDGMAELVREAQELGHLRKDVDAEQLAFELDAFLELANYHFVLFRDPAVLERGRVAVADRLQRAATPRRKRR
ncbi:MAG TPA: TetR/AcrR family transcriptional regulator, partial [Actinomycetota bacterium]|nr:TetR/AcrR family transcriptional regulator [Actinomycetota bacterium]